MVRVVVILLSVVFLSAGCASGPQRTASAPLTKAEYDKSLPPDVYPDSRSRIPLVKREVLDPAHQAVYDSLASPDTKSLAGLQGPGGIRLNASGKDNMDATHLDHRTRELARLVVAREMDENFEWTVHEPVARKYGLAPDIIDVIRDDRPLRGVPEREASIIELGREIFRDHRVSPETFRRVHAQLGTRNWAPATSSTCAISWAITPAPPYCCIPWTCICPMTSSLCCRQESEG